MSSLCVKPRPKSTEKVWNGFCGFYREANSTMIGSIFLDFRLIVSKIQKKEKKKNQRGLISPVLVLFSLEQNYGLAKSVAERYTTT
jgi:hypothetical protein